MLQWESNADETLLVNTEEKYQYELNLCDIYQFAADNVTSDMTVKRNTCSFDNKYCEKLWIAVYNQSATVTYMLVCHYKTISRHVTLPESCQKTN